jgi:alpha-acetolactate decarboxylase
MAHAAHAGDPIPRPPMSRPNFGLMGSALFALAVAALVAYGFMASRGPALRVTTPGVAVERTPGSIRTYGSIPALADGDTRGKISLSVLPSGSGVVAVGALSDLRGEIAIVRGVRWLSYPEGEGRMRVEETQRSQESAAFLAVADVALWQAQRLERAVPFEELAAELQARAKNAGIDPSRPFPLLIEGALTDVQLSVANGPALGNERPTPERVRATAAKATVPRTEGTVVGFFDASGGERLVDFGQRLHLHVVLPAERKAGHVESVRIEAGSLLRLPAMQ